MGSNCSNEQHSYVVECFEHGDDPYVVYFSEFHCGDIDRDDLATLRDKLSDVAKVKDMFTDGRSVLHREYSSCGAVDMQCLDIAQIAADRGNNTKSPDPEHIFIDMDFSDLHYIGGTGLIGVGGWNDVPDVEFEECVNSIVDAGRRATGEVAAMILVPLLLAVAVIYGACLYRRKKPAQTNATPETGAPYESCKECCICMDAASAVTIHPCAHKALCSACWAESTFTTCPICRGPVRSGELARAV